MSDQPASTSNFVTCHCEHCGGGIEFDASDFAQDETRAVECPHCKTETVIFVPEQKVPPIVSDDDFHLRNAREVEREEEIRKAGISASQNNPAATIKLETVHAQTGGVLPVISNQDFESPSAAIKPLHFVSFRCYRCGSSFKFNVSDLAEKETRTVRCPHCKKATAISMPEQKALTEELRREDDAMRLLEKANILANIESMADTAAGYYEKAAEMGNTVAQCKLAFFYMDGIGVKKNETAGIQWYLKAAESGHAFAEYSLGNCYYSGRGVAKDMSAALKWWRRAAEHGCADAQNNLGACYQKGEGLEQNYVEAYKWLRLAAAQGYEGAQKNCEELVLKMNAEQIAAVAPHHQMLWKRERLTLKRLCDFIGQNRIKARLELAIAAAKSRGEALGHILLIGSPGSGKATLANVIAKVMGANIKVTSGATINKCSDLAGLLTNLEEGDVLFIEEIHRLPRIIEEYLYLATKDFQLDIIIDSGPNAREVRLNLPRFTLIGSTTTRERLTPNLLSCFRVIENMDDYSVEELAAIVRRFATAFEVEIDADATDRIARSADGTPLDVLNRLRHVRDFAHVKGNGKITLEITEAAMKMLVSSCETPDARASRDAIPSAVRREVWRRDEGKCVKCGSRKNLEYDHIIPVAEGGSNTARNIELLCQDCNRAKSDLIQ
jgi:holliday junction DNA helicase RuvB